jgi:hypothetical protein
MYKNYIYIIFIFSNIPNFFSNSWPLLLYLLLSHMGTYASMRARTHTRMCIHKYNLLILFDVTYMCLRLGMSTWIR